MVPHLTTALAGPLLQLEKQVIEAQPDIEHWFRRQWMEHNAPFYSSVDLRNSGFKLAPVDTNLFPGGFNNLNRDFLPLAVQAAQMAVEKMCVDARRFLIIPENHTRNLFYLQNVAALADIIRKIGLTVRFGSLIPGLEAPLTLDLPEGGQLDPGTRQARGRPPANWIPDRNVRDQLRSLRHPAQQRPVRRRA
jgi:glutamate--cysteine ligase